MHPASFEKSVNNYKTDVKVIDGMIAMRLLFGKVDSCIHEIDHAMIVAGISEKFFRLSTLTPLYPLLHEKFKDPTYYKDKSIGCREELKNLEAKCTEDMRKAFVKIQNEGISSLEIALNGFKK